MSDRCANSESYNSMIIACRKRATADRDKEFPWMSYSRLPLPTSKELRQAATYFEKRLMFYLFGAVMRESLPLKSK